MQASLLVLCIGENGETLLEPLRHGGLRIDLDKPSDLLQGAQRIGNHGEPVEGRLTEFGIINPFVEVLTDGRVFRQRQSPKQLDAGEIDVKQALEEL